MSYKLKSFVVFFKVLQLQRPVKGTTASVNIVNAATKELEVKKLAGFSSFHPFDSLLRTIVYELKRVWYWHWQAYSLRGVANETAGSDVT